ncbi:MAG: 3-deoxy-8-phosphooctulonate synthase [Candidatus Cyclobacteriaceae bacterium M2_1C_046]
MKKYTTPVKINNTISVGNDKMILFAGPCAAENLELCLTIGKKVKEITDKLDIQYVFKASFDKANRTSVGSYRGKSMEEGLEILKTVKEELNVPVVTDIHESYQAEKVAEVADVLQIPAFLCRQTDLLLAAAETGKTVKVKKGQFMSPEDMQYAVNKIKSAGNNNVILTERGTTFGYNNLVVDVRSLPIMRQYAPVIFDVTHSVQRPGGAGGSSGGNREYAPYLAKAAAAAGVDGFFIETHPEPAKALSDGPNMIPLDQMEKFLIDLKRIWEIGK